MFTGPQICCGCQSQRTVAHSPGTLPGSPGDPSARGVGRGRGELWALSRPGSFLSPCRHPRLFPSSHLSRPLTPPSSPRPVHPFACVSLCARARLSLRPPIFPALTSSLSVLPPCICSSLLPSLPPSSPPSTRPVRPSPRPLMDLFIHPFTCPSFLPRTHPSATPRPLPPSSVHLFTCITNPPSPPPSPSNIDWVSSVLQALF